MTITLTFDYLVYFYWLIEIYMYVYCEELRVRSYYEYFEKIKDDCSEYHYTESIVMSLPISEPAEYSKPATVYSKLDEKTEGLFLELQQTLGLFEPVEEEPIMVYENINCESEHAEQENGISYLVDMNYDDELNLEEILMKAEEEDCIHLEDIADEVVPSSSIGYESYASAKIADCIDGPQKWVVSIIGMEDAYIHISDGKRIWVNIGEAASKLKNGDVVALDVKRESRSINVENIFLLEKSASDDYVIPDEEHYFSQDMKIAI